MKELRKNAWAIMVIAGLIVLIIIIIVAIGNKGTHSETDIVSEIIEEDIYITELDLNSELDIKLQDILAGYIKSGANGVYTIGDRHFVVLTSGKSTYSSIEYKLDTDKDSNNVLKWWYSDIAEGGEYKLSYKVLEVSSPNILVMKETSLFNEESLNGLCEVLVFNNNGNNTIYSINHNRILNEGTLNMPGTYMAEFIDGEISSMTEVSRVTLKNCTIVDRDSQSNRLYNVNIGDGISMEIYIDDINVDYGTNCNIQVSYDALLGVFRGSLIGGIA